MAKQRTTLPDRSNMALATDRPDVQEIPVYEIRANGGTQMRAGLNQETVREYQEWLQGLLDQGNLAQMPPIIVYYDGTDYWLADGFHRLAAWQHAGFAAGPLKLTIPAEVKAGTRRDAILHAAGANAAHGLRRTPADKWRAVESLLVDDEWSKWSDREIARRCHVSPTFVGQVRAKLGDPDRPQHAPPPLPVTVHMDSETPAQRTYTTKHGTTTTMNTANIGRQTRPEVWELERVITDWLNEQIPPDGDVSTFRGRLLLLDTLRTHKEDHEFWQDLVDRLPAGYRRRDLLQALNNVSDQITQEQRRRTEADLARRREQADQEPFDEKALPQDLREAGITIERIGSKWRWRRELPASLGVECGMPKRTPQEAILEARNRHAHLIQRTATAASPQDLPPGVAVTQDPRWEEEQRAAALLTQDLVEAGYSIRRDDQGWRWRRVLPDGGVEYGAHLDSAELAVKNARLFAEALGHSASAKAEEEAPQKSAEKSSAATVREAALRRAHRAAVLSRLRDLYREVLETLPRYEEATGLYTQSPALRRTLQPMLDVVERNLDALSGDEED